jgi:sugar phosphate isomerase/epimerase
MSRDGLQISLAAWSLHRMFRAGEIDQLGMVRLCAEMGIGGFEFVNTFFPSPQYRYLTRLRDLAAELDVRLLLIMCDGEGELASADASQRRQAAKNHYKWVDIAQVLGCHAIRCNVYGESAPRDVVRDRALEGLMPLLEYADAAAIDVVIENHGGLSSDPEWLVSLVQAAGHARLGTLPDFGNFPEDSDRYAAVRTMMPFAKAVSAKCYDFDAAGSETKIDFRRMLRIVKSAGYRGFVGIEYEGQRLSERQGIAACKALLERLI